MGQSLWMAVLEACEPRRSFRISESLGRKQYRRGQGSNGVQLEERASRKVMKS